MLSVQPAALLSIAYSIYVLGIYSGRIYVLKVYSGYTCLTHIRVLQGRAVTASDSSFSLLASDGLGYDEPYILNHKP